MQALRTDLPPLPPRFQALPLDERGYPVPWFVAWIDGEPDFRVVRQNGIAIAHNEKRCWLCGEKRGRFGAFVIGPMCAVNRVSSEPPSHLDCAQFAATACPFLTRPMAKRNEREGLGKSARTTPLTGVSDSLATPDGAKMAALFARIKGPRVRRQVLRLAEAVAEDGA